MFKPHINTVSPDLTLGPRARGGTEISLAYPTLYLPIGSDAAESVIAVARAKIEYINRPLIRIRMFEKSMNA